jgi:hypothetical protein
VSYYVLERGERELYAMNMTLTEDEARRYGREAETAVTAVFVWTDAQQIENFRQFVSMTQGDPNSPFADLIRSMREGEVNGLELSAVQLRSRLERYRRLQRVALALTYA